MNVSDYELFYAAQKGNIHQIKHLIDEVGVNPNIKTDRNVSGFPQFVTPLMATIISSKAQCIETLIECGADINCRKTNGISALMDAALESKVDCVKELLRLGASIHLLNDEDRNALDFACWSKRIEGKAECIDILLTQGCDMHRRDSYDETPFMAVISSQCINEEILDVFLKFEPELVNKYFHEAIEFAKNKDRQESLNCLLAYKENYQLTSLISGDQQQENIKF